MTKGSRRRVPELRKAIIERKGELLALLALAFLFYLGSSLSVPLSSFEVADSISEKANHHKPEADWMAFKHEVAHELEIREFSVQIRELLLHLAVAFFVATIIVIAFEMRSESEARQRLNEFITDAERLLEEHMGKLQEKQDEIARNLYAGVFKRYLPESLTKEIENLILEKFVKENCSYTLVFSDEGAQELSANQEFLLKRELRFRVRNFALSVARFPIISRIPQPIDPDTEGKSFTGHTGLWEGTRDRSSELDEEVGAVDHRLWRRHPCALQCKLDCQRQDHQRAARALAEGVERHLRRRRIPVCRREPCRRRQADRRDRRDSRADRCARAGRQPQEPVPERRVPAGLDGTGAGYGTTDRHDRPVAGQGHVHREVQAQADCSVT